MLDPISSAILLKIAVGAGGTAALAMARRSKRIMRWIRLKVAGSSYIAVGPSGSGKTSFFNFLQHDQVAAEHPTLPTMEVRKLGAFSVERPGDVHAKVSQATDVPGQLEIKEQVDEIIKRKPAALLVFCSLERRKDIDWLNRFSLSFAEGLSRHASVRKRFKAFFVVLNKSDLVSAETALKYLDAARTTVQTAIHPVFGERAKQIEFVTCSLFRRREANELLLRIFTRLHKPCKY